MKGRIDLGDVTPHNIKQLKRLNQVIFPVSYNDKFYKDVLEVGGYSVDFGKLEDYKLWIDLIISGKLLANLDDVLVNVRVGKGFIERRSNKREIQDWDMLQKYLLKGNMVSKKQALINRIYIRAFIYMPAWMKKIAYRTLLRKKN